MDTGSALESANEETMKHPSEGNHTGTFFHHHALPAKPPIDATFPLNPDAEADTSGAGQNVSQDQNLNTGKDQGNIATKLPPEILQHIFSFVDPISLGRLLSINRLFKALLDPTESLPSQSANAKVVQLRPQDDLWAYSRRRTFMSTYPRPMENMSELHMWKLIRGTTCQFCGEKPKNRHPIPAMAISPWNAGPGPEGVRAIWPFRCRSCGPCLETRIVKETDVLLSSKSGLLPGLPFALFTPSLNYVISVMLRQTQPPPGLQLTKYYFQSQIDELDRDQNEVRSLGTAATQEWYKGLETRGQTQMKEVARIEQWQLDNRPPPRPDPVSAGLLSGSTSPAYSLASSAMYSHQLSVESPYRPFSAQNTPVHSGLSSGPLQYAPGSLPSMPLQNFAPAPGQASQQSHPLHGPFSTQHISSGRTSFQSGSHPRQERNFQEIDRLKSDRRTEIRRRCLELHPPIQPSTLDFMDAFNAAIQIARPLNENDWNVLKSRLLTQREEAEQKERRNNAAARASQMVTEERQKSDQQRLQAQDSADRIWSEIQKPSRDKARENAEDYIRAHWADGRAVNKVSSGRFAADVLIQVRRRYYETIEQENTLLASQSMTIPSDSPIHESRRLKLEDMKFVYEETIRPRVDRFGREVFLCITCEANAKRFTFDAVIQHYAAKHTSSLSLGNAVVYWKADWPAESPFHPTPETVWNRPPEQRSVFAPYGATSPAYTPAYTPHPGASWMSPPAPGQPNGIYHVQSEELVASARRIWEAIDDIRYLPSSLRLHAIIHQVAMSFSQKFTNEPTLSMFSDCVNHKPLLKCLKELSGLCCRACHTYGEAAGTTTEEFVLPDLLQHFQRTHVEYDARSPQSNFTRPTSMSSMSIHRMDWKFDMVDLPPEPVVRGIIHLPGMNQQKLEIIAEALPAFFPPPLPRIDPVPNTEEEYLPHRPQPLTSHVGERDPRITFKRPLDEDQYSYPPSLRRVVEYDPYRPEIQLDSYQADGRAGMYTERIPNGRIVYVDRGYSEQPYTFETRPFPRPHAATARYPPPGGVDDGTHPHVIREVIDDHSSDARFRGHLSLPVPEPQESRRRPISPTGDQRDSYQDHSDGLSAAEQFLNNFESNNLRPYQSDGGPDARVSSRGRVADRGTHSHATTPARSRHNGDPSLDHGPGSGRHSPRPEVPERLRSRNPSPIPPIDGGLRSPQHEAFSSHNEEAMMRNNNRLASSPVPSRRGTGSGAMRRSPLQRGNEESSPRGEGAVPYEYDSYADDRTTMPRRPVFERQPPSPEIRYQRYEERRPVRYIEVLPNGQRRVVEELPSPTFERFEYMGVPPRESYYPDRGAYILDQPPPPPRGYRLEHETDRGVYAVPPTYAGENIHSQYRYRAGPSSQDLLPPPPPGMRNVKYEVESYDRPGSNEADH